MLHWQSWVPVTQIEWATKPKLFTTCSFTEKFLWPLDWWGVPVAYLTEWRLCVSQKLFSCYLVASRPQRNLYKPTVKSVLCELAALLNLIHLFSSHSFSQLSPTGRTQVACFSLSMAVPADVQTTKKISILKSLTTLLFISWVTVSLLM